MEQLDTVEKAIDLFRSGDKATASRLLAQQVTQNPKNDTAWLWLAVSLDQPDQQLYCLKKAQALNPENPVTLEALNDYLGLNRPVREEGSPINLPAPEAPARAEITPDSPTGPLPHIKPKKKVLTGTQILLLAILVVAILVVIAVMVYLYVTADPSILPPFLQSMLGLGSLLLPAL